MRVKVVPVEPTSEIELAARNADMLFGTWRSVWRHAINASPDTGYVAVRHDLLLKMWRTIEVSDSFNSFTPEEESEMIDALSGAEVTK